MPGRDVHRQCHAIEADGDGHADCHFVGRSTYRRPNPPVLRLIVGRSPSHFPAVVRPGRLLFKWGRVGLLTPRCDVSVSGRSKLAKSKIASSLKATNVLPHFLCPRITRLCNFRLRQPKTRLFEVLEYPVPSSQFHDEGAHTDPLGSLLTMRSWRKPVN